LKTAYVDSSCFVAIALGEPKHEELLLRLSRFDRLISSHLLEAEFRSALAREGVPGRIRNLLAWVTWMYPTRRLSREFDQVFEKGVPKGADLWHLACAIYVRESMGTISFLTLDGNQAHIAQTLGFPGL
jgi:predicted nucleic acid-binding protein